MGGWVAGCVCRRCGCVQASEWEFTIELALFLVGLAFEGGWDSYATNIQMICKRRQQHRTVVAAVVKDAIPKVETTPDEATKLALIECLRTVSEGKIFLEVERARLTRTLSQMQEKDGKFKEAAKTLQEVAVETYGTMENKEKVEFILEQVRPRLRLYALDAAEEVPVHGLWADLAGFVVT